MMTRRMRAVFALSGLIAVSSCGCATSPPARDYSRFRECDPYSIVVVPAVNRSVNVDAPDHFLSTISRPLAERGYYVFPVNMVKRTMEDGGLSDADLVHKADPVRVAELFNADTVLYVTIERWDAQYVVLSTQVTVEFTYVLNSGATGEELWRDTQQMVYSPSASSSGNLIADLISAAVTAAVTKAAPNYVPLTQIANSIAVVTPGTGLPAGPYREEYKQDMDEF